MSVSTRVDLALLGFRGRPPVSRTAGAGPSADGHLVIDGLNAAIPRNPQSPFVFDGTRVLLDGVDTGLDVEVIDRPRFYDLTTEDGVPYEKLARLHGRNVLATTVVQTCIRYAEDQRCRFCTIEESLRSGATTAVKRPAELAAVAEAAVRGPIQIAVACDGGSALLAAARKLAPGGAVVIGGALDSSDLLIGRDRIGGRDAAYVCRGRTCDMPVTTVEDLAAALSRAV